MSRASYDPLIPTETFAAIVAQVAEIAAERNLAQRELDDARRLLAAIRAEVGRWDGYNGNSVAGEIDALVDGES